MLQIYDAVFQTAIRLGEQYGRWLVLGVLVFVGVGFALRILTRILHGSGPKEP
jgi:hypothetical protein